MMSGLSPGPGLCGLDAARRGRGAGLHWSVGTVRVARRAGPVPFWLDLRPDDQSSVLVPRRDGHQLPRRSECHSAARSGGITRRPGRAPVRRSKSDHADRGYHSGRGSGLGPRRLDCHPGQLHPMAPHFHVDRSRRRAGGAAPDERGAPVAAAAMEDTRPDPAEQIPLIRNAVRAQWLRMRRARRPDGAAGSTPRWRAGRRPCRACRRRSRAGPLMSLRRLPPPRPRPGRSWRTATACGSPLTWRNSTLHRRLSGQPAYGGDAQGVCGNGECGVERGRGGEAGAVDDPQVVDVVGTAGGVEYAAAGVRAHDGGAALM
jgi:hypothetical protein